MAEEQQLSSVNYFTCPAGDPHMWDYRGRRAQAYRCRRCQLVVSKATLKEETD